MRTMSMTLALAGAIVASVLRLLIFLKCRRGAGPMPPPSIFLTLPVRLSCALRAYVLVRAGMECAR